jgi:hypothetical protein
VKSRFGLPLAPFMLAPFMVLPLLVGCNDGYSTEVRYPTRTDGILTGTFTLESPVTDPPGLLPAMNVPRLRHLPTLDPKVFPPQPWANWINASVKNPADLVPSDRVVLQSTLEEMFGTPAAPKVSGGDPGVTEQLVSQLKLTPEILDKGSRHYRAQCLHCHGLAGDGRGPTSFWINPHPRDYRKGMYKFVSTAQPQGGEQRARREDIIRTITHGIDGTAMPAFNILPTEEIEAIASYVIHLGLRGEVEEDAILRMLNQAPNDREWDPKEMISGGLKVFGGYWLKSQKELEPDAYPVTNDEEFGASVKRGFEIFKLEEAKGGGDCLKCHSNYGRGSPFRFDDWGTMTKPADVTLGIYRGGRRPIDLYWRIYNGIAGSGMKESSKLAWNAEQKKSPPKDEKIWDLVNFLQVLPYPQMRAKYDIKID